MHLAHKFATRVFYLIIFSSNFDDQLRPVFHRFIMFNAYMYVSMLGYTNLKWELLAFDNYQSCSVPLKLFLS